MTIEGLSGSNGLANHFTALFVDGYMESLGYWYLDAEKNGNSELAKILFELRGQLLAARDKIRDIKNSQRRDT